jgi:two-component system NtrC family sensor kinase
LRYDTRQWERDCGRLMTNVLTSISKSLAAKLIITLVSFIVIGGGTSWYFLVRTDRTNRINEAVKDAVSYSDLVKKSVRYDMLTFNREAIQKTMEDLGSAKDIRGIRLFDGKGTVFFSSKREEIGLKVDRTARACRGCHGGTQKPSETLPKDSQWATYHDEGRSLLTFVDPIKNEPSCSTMAACHVHSPNQRVLGILESDLSLAAVDQAIKEQTIHTTVSTLALMGMIALILYVVLRKFVLKPVTSLSNAMETVAQGDLERTVTASSDDEIGMLVHTFNGMTRELKAARIKMEAWTESLEREVEKKTEALKKSQDKLVQAEKLAALGRMTADVAHEIRNPLTAIGGFARRLSKSAAGEKEKERVEIIVREVDRLEKILGDVLKFSRDARFHIEKHEIGEFLYDVAGLHEPLCSDQSVSMEVVVEKDLPPVLMDKDQLRQALTNLINNALDAMPRGGELKISAGTEYMNDVRYVVLRVSDTGMGIDQDKLPNVFDPFFSTKTIGHGTGLGLSITSKIVEEHGGFVKAESVKGQGSIFSLYFPQPDGEKPGELKCWEYKKCGRDKDATKKCPAQPHFGSVCWVVAGTFCEGKVQGTFAQKYEDCRKCDFYQAAKKLREKERA